MKIFWQNDGLNIHSENPEERHALAVQLRRLKKLTPESETVPSTESSDGTLTDKHHTAALSS
jgi:hypothetical protein